MSAPDEGDVRLYDRDGQELDSASQPGIVHQDLGLTLSLTVAENLYLGRLEEFRSLYLSPRLLARRARLLLDQYGIDVEPERRLVSLPRHVHILLAIVRALEAAQAPSRPSLLVLDETTAGLGIGERNEVYGLVESFRAAGGAILLVSHDLDEMLAACQTVSVLRDGALVVTRSSAGLTSDTLSSAMFAEGTLSHDDNVKPCADQQKEGIQAEVMEVTGLKRSSRIGVASQGYSATLEFKVPIAQITGITGLAGSGAEEILPSLYGATSGVVGNVILHSASYDLSQMTPRRALDIGIHLLPMDRLHRGGIGVVSMSGNVAMPFMRRWRAWRWPGKPYDRRVGELLDAVDVVPRNPFLAFSNFSGGNQQKALLAKWLEERPKVLLVEEPTEGVDMRSREYLWSRLRAASRAGITILCYSVSYDELVALCDTVMVVRNWQIVRTLTGDQLTKHELAKTTSAG